MDTLIVFWLGLAMGAGSFYLFCYLPIQRLNRQYQSRLEERCRRFDNARAD